MVVTNVVTCDRMTNKATYRLIGVDPGTNLMGYAILEISGSKIKLVTMDTLNMKNQGTHQEKLKRIYQELDNLIAEFRPITMAIEAPFFGKNVQSMLKLGRAQGVAIAAGMARNLEITEYAPKKVKQSVTGNGNASKEQVAAMVENILGLKLPDHGFDAKDAAAVAICHHYQSGSPFAKKKKFNSWSAFLKENPQRAK